MNWSIEEAVELCCRLEIAAKDNDCHIGLTGGCLYKVGRRKDVDIIIYKVRQVKELNFNRLFRAFESVVDGLQMPIDPKENWLYKATYKDKGIDFFYPESPTNEEKDGVLYGL